MSTNAPRTRHLRRTGLAAAALLAGTGPATAVAAPAPAQPTRVVRAAPAATAIPLPSPGCLPPHALIDCDHCGPGPEPGRPPGGAWQPT